MKRITLYIALGLICPYMVQAQVKDKKAVEAAASPQTRQSLIKGKVSDKQGPIPSATVMEIGNPKNTVMTDDKGNFQIKVSTDNASLQISTIGYKTKVVNAAKQTVINVQLEESAIGMNEVVVVGFGTQKKITNTGAVSMISGKDIRQSPSASIQNALVGRLPGLFQQQTSGQPGKDGAAFFIRGQSTYNDPSNNNRPLIIVDDIEYSYDQVNQIDPNEVESVAILKDASTTAIYGIKGANGVLVITTRRGVQGAPKITLRSEFGLQVPTVYRKPLPANEALALIKEQYVNQGIDPESQMPGYFSDDALEHFRLGDQPYKYPNVNWYDAIMRKSALQQRNNVDINGGTKNVRYFVSLGYIFQDGILKNVQRSEDFNSNYYLKRYNFRSNLDVDVTKDLSLRLDLSARFSEVNEPNLPDVVPGGAWPFWRRISSGLLAPWIYPIYNPDGSYGGRKGATLNPIGILQYAGYKRNYSNDLNANLSANHKLDFITQGLSAKVTMAFTNDFGSNRNLTRGNFPTFEYISGSNTYEPVDPSLLRIPLLSLSTPWDVPVRKMNLQAFLNYRRTFNNNTFYGVALFNQSTNIGNPATDAAGTASLPDNFRGYALRVGYDYKSKYLLEFNMGYNGTDRFKAKNRFGFFPAVSAGWNISEESFFKNNVSFVNYLKIRGSYGEVGSDRVSGYKYIYDEVYNNGSGYSFGETPYNPGSLTPGQLANQDVRWEKERKINLGLDMKMWSSKIGLTVELFDHNRYDILSQRGSVPNYTGISLPPVNIGKVNNRGIEIELTHNNNIGAFNYFVKGNISFAKNKIVYRDEAPNLANPLLNQTGRPIGQIYGYTFDGFYYDDNDVKNSPQVTGKVVKPGDIKFKDINGDGVIDAKDIGPIGYPNLPQITYGFSTGLSYKNFDISVLFQGAARGSFNASTMLMMGSSNGVPSAIHQQRWTPENRDNAQYPRLGGVNFDMSTFWLRPLDYLRLKNVELGYRLPKRWVDKLRLADVRIYANGMNLLTWFNLKIYDVDPESASDAAAAGYSNYPQQRIFNAGLQVSFK